MFVDIYTHILPSAVAAALEQLGSGFGIAKRMKAVRNIYDFDSRFRSMDEIGDYRQIVSLPNPPLEAFTTPKQATDLARIANDSMAELVMEGAAPFDFIFIDADKPGYPAYLTLALKLVRPGTLIMADNMVRKGKVADAKSRDEAVQGARKFNALIAKNPRLEATAVQTVGSKGYDGFVLARVIS